MAAHFRAGTGPVSLRLLAAALLLAWSAAAPALAWLVRLPALWHGPVAPEHIAYVAAAALTSFLVIGIAIVLTRTEPFPARVAVLAGACGAAVLLAVFAMFLHDRAAGLPRSVPPIHFGILTGGVLLAAVLAWVLRDDASGGLSLQAGASRLRAWGAGGGVAALADWMAIAALAAIPWSTSLTAIFAAAFIVLALPLLRYRQVVEALRHPAVSLPIALWVMMAVGMFWSHTTWAVAIGEMRPFHKILVLPLVMIHFTQSRRGLVGFGLFVASATVLLAWSWASWMWPALLPAGRAPGVPVKDTIFQGMICLLAACVYVHLALAGLRKGRIGAALALTLLALAFIANVLLVTVSRTTLVAGPLLLAIVGFTHLRLKGSLVIVAVCAGLGATVWLASPDVRERTSLFAEFATGAAVTDASGSLRLQFWRIAVDKVKEAPVFGSGTGSLRGLFSTAKTDGVVDLSAGTENPHNQTFAIAIQVGVIGLLVLYGLWLAHALLFIRSGAAEASRIVWASRFGLLIVVQNFLGSLFNTHLSDFTSGWLYALGVGILGGTVLRPHLTYRRGPAA